MQMKYIEPEMEIEKLEMDDIVTSSLTEKTEDFPDDEIQGGNNGQKW